jgi:galacturonosyltransferase
MRKKFLVLANNSDGLYGFRKELLSALNEKGQVYTSVPNNERFEELEQLGCHIIETPIDRRGINPVTDLKLFARYWKLLRREKPDMVITYTIKPNIYGGMACRMLGVPYAVNITGLGTAFQKEGLLKNLVTFLYRTALKMAKVVFFENSGNRQVFLEEGIVAEDKTCLLSGAGVNLEHYAYTSYPEGKGTQFLFVGRVMKEKGIEELFAAMERLRAEGADCCLDVLGGYEENYAETIRRYEEQGWLHYHGYVTDVRPYIEKAHCFVLPSYHEGMANTNLECAAMGRPLITSNIPGCKEAVLDGVSGLLCEPQDADSLYEAMKYFLSLPTNIRAQMGKAGRKHMEDTFDKKKVVEETMKALGL